jgi:carboxylesterase
MTTCILVHGFTGSPADLEPLANHLQSTGYLVESPVLYGHGGSKEDLRKATVSSWVHSVEPVVKRALESGEHVHLVGFSLGAMISAIVAGHCEVNSVTMLAPAVYYTGTSQLFHEMASAIKAVWNRGDGGRDYVRSRVDKMSTAPLESVRHFRRLIQMGKTALPKVTQPLCIVQGMHDQIVDPKGAEYALQTVSSLDKEIHYLQHSGHMLCQESESDTVNQLVAQFLHKVESTTERSAP